MPLLGYERWENFDKAIGRAVESCRTSGIEVSDHFREVTKMVRLGSGSQWEIKDYKNPFTLLLTQTMKRDMWYSTLKSIGTEVGYMKEKTLSMQKLSSQLSTEGDILLSPR